MGRLGGRALLLVNQVLLARLLGPAEFGLFALGWTVVQMGGVILPLGLHQGLLRYGSAYWGKADGTFRAVLQQSLGLVVVFAAAAAVALFVGAPWLASGVFQKPELVEVFRGLAPALALAALLRVAAAGTRVSQRMQFSVLAEDWTPSAAQLLLVILLVALAGRGLAGAVLSANVAFAAGVGLAFLFLWRLFGRELRSAAAEKFSPRELLAFSLPASLAGIFVMLTLRVDRLLVGYFLDASEVAVYQAASQAAMLSAIVLTAFNAIFAPMIAQLYHEGQRERLNELFKVSTKWGLYVALPPFLVLAAAPGEVMEVVFGEAYAAGAVPMLLMAGAQLVNAGTGAVGLLLIMTGHPRRWLALSAASFLTNIVLGLVLIPRVGILGAAMAVAASVTVLFLSGLIQVHRLLRLWPYDYRYVKGLLAALVTLALLVTAKLLFPDDVGGVVCLAIMGAGGLLLFAALLAVLRLDPEDQEMIRLLLAKLSGPVVGRS